MEVPDDYEDRVAGWWAWRERWVSEREVAARFVVLIEFVLVGLRWWLGLGDWVLVLQGALLLPVAWWVYVLVVDPRWVL